MDLWKTEPNPVLHKFIFKKGLEGLISSLCIQNKFFCCQLVNKRLLIICYLSLFNRRHFIGNWFSYNKLSFKFLIRVNLWWAVKFTVVILSPCLQNSPDTVFAQVHSDPFRYWSDQYTDPRLVVVKLDRTRPDFGQGFFVAVKTRNPLTLYQHLKVNGVFSVLPPGVAKLLPHHYSTIP